MRGYRVLHKTSLTVTPKFLASRLEDTLKDTQYASLSSPFFTNFIGYEGRRQLFVILCNLNFCASCACMLIVVELHLMN